MDLFAVLIDGFRQALGVEAVVFAIVAIGLNIHFGYTGLLNFGQVGFMLVGAYGVAIMARPCEGATQGAVAGPCGQSLWLGLLMGIGLAIVLALLLGIPTLRLRADYLAITTIAASEILRLVFRTNDLEPLTGGNLGIPTFAAGFHRANFLYGRSGSGAWFTTETGNFFGRLNYSGQDMWTMTIGWLLVIVLSILVFLVMRAPWGRVLKSIREDEDAARALGKNVFSFKMQSLIIGGVIGAIGGSLLALGNQNVSPDTFIPIRTFFAYVIIILGGAGTVWGPIIGTWIFFFLRFSVDRLLRELITAGVIPTTVLELPQVGPIQLVLVGALLALLMAFRPQGILGNKEEMLLDAR